MIRENVEDRNCVLSCEIFPPKKDTELDNIEPTLEILCDLKPDDDCSDAEPLADIGILASLDPVAADQAAVDFTFGAAPSKAVREAWEQKHNVRLLQYAEERGVGKRNYRLVQVD